MHKHRKKLASFFTFKNTVLIGFGVLVIFLMAYYIGKYIVRNRAAGNPVANMALQGPSGPVNMSVDSNFNVTFNINGQKVTAAELYVDFDPAFVEYYKEFNGGSGFSEIKDPGKENYFDVPLIEEVTSPDATTKRLRLVLVSKFNDPANPNWTTNVTGNLKFRAKAAGSTNISVNKTVTLLAGIVGAGEATYFDLPTTDVKAAITISGSQTTITPSVSPTMPVQTPTAQPTVPLTGTPSPTISPTGTIPITDVPPDLTLCKPVDPAANNVDTKKRYDVLIIPDNYADLTKFETDAKTAANYFKSANSSITTISKVNFIMYMKAKTHDVAQCDPTNGVKHACWSKTKAKDTLHECGADGYVILAYTPTIQEDSAKTMESYNFWGKTSGATWGLGSGESLIMRYNLNAIQIALTRAIAGVWNNATNQDWERALLKFQ